MQVINIQFLHKHWPLPHKRGENDKQNSNLTDQEQNDKSLIIKQLIVGIVA